jgi:ribonuclease HI
MTHQPFPHEYDIFTDGSAIRDKKYQITGLGWAFVIFKDKVQISSGCGSLHDFTVGTNQQTELYAIEQSLIEIVDKFKPGDFDTVNIYTDSEYSKQCVTVWYLNWITNGWKTAKKQPVKHKVLIENIVDKLTALKQDNISANVIHVKAHTDRTDYISAGNREADRLAYQCSKSGSVV